MHAGLQNLGNTCYLNTTLQCLAHCTSFVSWVTQYIPQGNQPLFRALQDTYTRLQQENTTVAPKTLLQHLHQTLGSLLPIHEPNDINEFVVLFLDKLHEEMAQPLSKHPFKHVVYSNLPFDIQRQRMDEAWYQSIHKQHSHIQDLFYGQLVSQILCGHCQKVHHNYEVFGNKMISIHGDTLDTCLQHHFQDEVMNATQEDPMQDPWVCDACQQSKPSTKTVRLWRNPRILLLSIKRFTAHMRKIPTEVGVPLRLDLQPYTLGPTGTRYELKSVGFHAGSFHGGHYFAVCKHPDNNTWYLKDDDHVQPFPQEHLSQLGKGYLFCYELLSNS